MGVLKIYLEESSIEIDQVFWNHITLTKLLILKVYRGDMSALHGWKEGCVCVCSGQNTSISTE